MSALSAAGGNYYATAHEVRDDGKRFGRQVARQRKTLAQARRALEEADLPGYVQLWIDHEAQRRIVAERDEAGNWWAWNPHTGNLDPLAPLSPACPE